MLRSGRSGLRVVFRTRDLTVFAVPAPTGILSGGPAARLVALSQTRLVLRIVQPGHYRLAVRYTPYWRISSGCVTARADGMSEVFAPRPGTVGISFHVDVGKALAALVDEPTRTCAAVSRPPLLGFATVDRPRDTHPLTPHAPRSRTAWRSQAPRRTPSERRSGQRSRRLPGNARAARRARRVPVGPPAGEIAGRR